MRRRARFVLGLVLLAAVVPALPVQVAGALDAVVSSPCDEVTFDAALATVHGSGGGTLTFNCGGAATIVFSGEKIISMPVVIDGSGATVLSGGLTTRHFTVDPGASLELRNITLTEGFVDDDGGSIENNGGTLTISNSTFSSNTASSLDNGGIRSGGAISSSGPLAITNSVFIDNLADASPRTTGGEDAVGGIADGGAIHQSGSLLTIIDSTFSDNTAIASPNAQDGGNAVGGIAQGGAIVALSGLEITGSTFSNNTADSGPQAFGGGDATGGLVGGGAVYSLGVTNITNSTFSSNLGISLLHADSGGAVVGGLAQGGAIFSLAALTVTSTTIASNVASVPTGGLQDGGGIYDPSSTTLQMTIVAANIPNDCSGTFVSNDYNLDSDNTCNLTGPNDIANGNANLGPLADNGGLTQTRLPLAGSDAINNGPSTCLATDQRGLPRPVGPACDIGSVEVQPPPPTLALCADRFTGRVLSPANGVCHPTKQLQLDAPGGYPLAFCIDPYTGIVHYTFGRPCTPPRRVHVVPTNGSLLTCVNLYTRVNRQVFNHAQCLASEVPNIVPAA